MRIYLFIQSILKDIDTSFDFVVVCFAKSKHIVEKIKVTFHFLPFLNFHPFSLYFQQLVKIEKERRKVFRLIKTKHKCWIKSRLSQMLEKSIYESSFLCYFISTDFFRVLFLVIYFAFLMKINHRNWSKQERKNLKIFFNPSHSHKSQSSHAIVQ